MTVKELIQLLSELPEESELQFVTILDDGVTSQVDDIALEISPANERETCFYMYSEEAIAVFEGRF